MNGGGRPFAHRPSTSSKLSFQLESAAESRAGRATVQPGIVQNHIDAHLAEHGLKFAPDPTSSNRAEGDELDLGELVAAFHEATFPEAPVHVWLSERATGMSFPVDWMGFPRFGDEALTFVDELGDLDVGQFVEFHSRVLFWYQYVNAAKVRREIDRLIAKFNPEIVAPGHGLVIRGDAVKHMDLMKEVPGMIEEQGHVGTLG